MEKLYRKPTETEQNLKKNYDPTVGLNSHLKLSMRESFPNWASKQLGGAALKRPYKL